VVGSLVNDSGAIVGGVTLTVVAASLVCLVLEPDQPLVVAAGGGGEGLVAPSTEPERREEPEESEKPEEPTDGDG
jgi:hypothetical protein